MWTDLQSIQIKKLTLKGTFMPLLRVYISKFNVVSDLMSIIPSIQNTLLGIVVNLCGVGVVVNEGHPGNHLSIRVCVESIFQVGLPLVIAVNSIQDATNNEAVAKVISSKPRPPSCLPLHAEVRGVQTA